MTKRPPKTAGELMAELERNPEYVARRAEEEKARLEIERASRAEQAPLLRDLAAVGTRVETVWDLVNSPNNYSEAIPVLTEHLERPYSAGIKEGIARALSIRSAGRAAYDAIVREYRRSPDPSPQGVKFALANAMSVVADRSAVDELMQIARDPREGENRAPLLAALARLGGPSVAGLLEELLDDPLIGEDARKALKRLRR